MQRKSSLRTISPVIYCFKSMTSIFNTDALLIKCHSIFCNNMVDNSMIAGRKIESKFHLSMNICKSLKVTLVSHGNNFKNQLN